MTASPPRAVALAVAVLLVAACGEEVRAPAKEAPPERATTPALPASDQAAIRALAEEVARLRVELEAMRKASKRAHPPAVKAPARTLDLVAPLVISEHDVAPPMPDAQPAADDDPPDAIADVEEAVPVAIEADAPAEIHVEVEEVAAEPPPEIVVEDVASDESCPTPVMLVIRGNRVVHQSGGRTHAPPQEPAAPAPRVDLPAPPVPLPPAPEPEPEPEPAPVVAPAPAPVPEEPPPAPAPVQSAPPVVRVVETPVVVVPESREPIQPPPAAERHRPRARDDDDDDERRRPRARHPEPKPEPAPPPPEPPAPPPAPAPSPPPQRQPEQPAPPAPEPAREPVPAPPAPPPPPDPPHPHRHRK